MLEDYCNQLQNLNKQKNRFLKLKYKQSSKNALEKQENKYHRYILSQISYKNKLDSLYKFNFTFKQIFKRKFSDFFTRIQSQNSQAQIISSNKKSQHQNEIISKENQSKEQGYNNGSKNPSDSNLKLKNLKQDLILRLKSASCRLLCKGVQNLQKKLKKNALKSIQYKKQATLKIEGFYNILEQKLKFQINGSFEQLKKYIKHQKLSKECEKSSYNRLSCIQPKESNKLELKSQNQNKSFIFSLNQLSQIFPYTIQEQSQEFSTSRIKKIQEIDSKFKPLSTVEVQIQQNALNYNKQFEQMRKSYEKLRDQVLIMKKILSQKNQQLKSKDQQISKIRNQYQKKIQALYDQLSSKIEKQIFDGNSSRPSASVNLKNKYIKQSSVQLSYLKQLQNNILGDRYSNLQLENDSNVNQQLLHKYMKETLQMRQKMDIARQMCEQFQFNSRTQQGLIMTQIIRLLTPQQRINCAVD